MCHPILLILKHSPNLEKTSSAPHELASRKHEIKLGHGHYGPSLMNGYNMLTTILKLYQNHKQWKTKHSAIFLHHNWYRSYYYDPRVCYSSILAFYTDGAHYISNSCSKLLSWDEPTAQLNSTWLDVMYHEAYFDKGKSSKSWLSLHEINFWLSYLIKSSWFSNFSKHSEYFPVLENKHS